MIWHQKIKNCCKRKPSGKTKRAELQRLKKAVKNHIELTNKSTRVHEGHIMVKHVDDPFDGGDMGTPNFIDKDIPKNGR